MLSSLFKLLRRSNGTSSGANRAHMTWAHTSVGRTVSRTGVFLKKQLWVFPILAIVVLASVGYLVRSAIERTMKSNLRSQLETLRSVESSMIQTCLKVQEANVQTQASDLEIRSHIYKLLDEVDPTKTPETPLKASPLHALLRKDLGPEMSAHDYHGFFVVDRTKRVISADVEELIGREDGARHLDSFVTKALEGEVCVTPPFPGKVLLRDSAGELQLGVPTMWACAPVRDSRFQVVAVLGLRIRPEKEFTRILQLGQIGSTGETYAFDKSGRMVSNSRFDESLVILGLLPDEGNSRSLLNLQLRDPGGDLAAGFRPTKRRSGLPLTRMATDAIAGNTGVDVEGYRDYRGVPVSGAWTWLPKYEMGVATEIDVAEAFRPLSILQWTFWALYVLLAAAALAIFVFTLIVARLRRQAQKAVIESQKLGQYTLDKKLGSGGMGVVYKGHHAVLRRPTAIKMLSLDKVNEGSIERFEREVQITCQLNHPNTVAVYDYGRTPEGVFYYAMEYLDGIDLEALVKQYGPQPEGRVIHILQQVCGSLYEAHSLGLVHRDIKPANIMLNRRGGEPDVAKVLDFGLVKALDEQKQTGLTAANSLTGTPLYMSPEAIQTPNAVDPRSDIYAVGAVGYFLLTGQAVFDAHNIVELCQAHVTKVPDPPSQRLGKSVTAELENALLACLDKSRAKRPQTARDLAVLLGRSPTASSWPIEEADAWWGRHERGLGVPGAAVTPASNAESSSASSAYDQTYVSNAND